MRSSTAASPRAGSLLGRAALVVALVALPRLVQADGTVFVGASATPASRPVRGFAIGVSLLIVGFEFEYANTVEDLSQNAPSLRTGMGNVLVQTPTQSQLYATVGAGLYREILGPRQETHAGINLGAGVKLSLLGPFRLRLDYRVFALRGAPLHSNPQRFYAGMNLMF